MKPYQWAIVAHLSKPAHCLPPVVCSMFVLPSGNAHVQNCHWGYSSLMKWFLYFIVIVILGKHKMFFRLYFSQCVIKMFAGLALWKIFVRTIGRVPFCSPNDLKWVVTDVVTVNHLEYNRHSRYGTGWIPSWSPPLVMYQGFFMKTSTMSHILG